MISRRTCSVRRCDRRHYAKGYCSAHYCRHWKIGTVRASKPIEPRGQNKHLSCKIKGCDRNYSIKGYCHMHHRLRLRREVKARLVAGFGDVCYDCKNSYHPLVFQFHHRLPRYKKFEIGPALVNKTWAVIRKEAQKCDMLCPTCHAIRHVNKNEEIWND